jgi:tRNA dimethylallyltransferase
MCGLLHSTQWMKPASSVCLRAFSTTAVTAVDRPRVCVITAPTATGKSALAVRVAQRLGGEVISADSVQLYRELNIGSNKIPVAEQGGIPHHLLDVTSMSSTYSAGQFSVEAHDLIRDIQARGRVPIIAGGTGLYLRFLMFGMPQHSANSHVQRNLDLVHDNVESAMESATMWIEKLLGLYSAGYGDREPPISYSDSESDVVLPIGKLTDAMNATGTDIESLDQIIAYGDQLSKAILLEWEHTFRQVVTTQHGAEVATVIQEALDKNNVLRAKRRLQIALTTGSAPRPYPANSIADSREMDIDFRSTYIHPPRLWLYRLIDYRCELMLARGLIPEVRRLRQQGLSLQSTAGRSIGYRDTLQFLTEMDTLTNGQQSLDAHTSDWETYSRMLHAFLVSFQAKTRQYSRRQITWFKSEPIFRWTPLHVSKTLPPELSTAVAWPPNSETCPLDFVPSLQDLDEQVDDIIRHFEMPHKEYWDMVASDSFQQQQHELQETLTSSDSMDAAEFIRDMRRYVSHQHVFKTVLKPASATRNKPQLIIDDEIIQSFVTQHETLSHV